jgi:hypothetical protein
MDDAGARLLPWPQARVNLEVGLRNDWTCTLDLHTSLTKATILVDNTGDTGMENGTSTARRLNIIGFGLPLLGLTSLSEHWHLLSISA